MVDDLGIYKKHDLTHMQKGPLGFLSMFISSEWGPSS